MHNASVWTDHDNLFFGASEETPVWKLLLHVPECPLGTPPCASDAADFVASSLLEGRKEGSGGCFRAAAHVLLQAPTEDEASHRSSTSTPASTPWRRNTRCNPFRLRGITWQDSRTRGIPDIENTIPHTDTTYAAPASDRPSGRATLDSSATFAAPKPTGSRHHLRCLVTTCPGPCSYIEQT